jgi:hypothetical protein
MTMTTLTGPRVVAYVPPALTIHSPEVLRAAQNAAAADDRILTTDTPTLIPWPQGMWPHLVPGPLLVAFPTTARSAA